MLSTLMKKSKMNYYNHYFKNNWDNIKNTWKGIKSILTINNTHSNIHKSLVSNNTTSAVPIEIANIFNIKLNMKLTISYPLFIQTNQLDQIVCLLRS